MNSVIYKAGTSRHIYRYEVPVDDQWHTLSIGGDPLYVAARRPDVVEFWAVDEEGPGVPRAFRVVGTGHLMPTDWDVRYVGSAITAGGMLVWHLLEMAR